MMTRKDYITTAQIISGVKGELSEEVHSHLVNQFSTMFAKDNKNFDPQRFKEAAGKPSK